MELVNYKDFAKKTGVKITVKHNGKMKGMQSLSTSCMTNRFCQKRIEQKDTIQAHNYSIKEKPKIVCYGCYAVRQEKMYQKLRNMTARNGECLKEIIDYKDLPNLNCLYFRFEAFGDLDNENQFINYLNICKKNPKTKFAIWTKNPWIIQNVFEMGYKKPKNLNIIFSSLIVNQVSDTSYKWVDKVFTVYDKGYIEEHNVNINCGAKSCFKCLKCYKKTDKDYYINEKLK